MGNGTKIPNWVSESVRARATVAVTVFRDLTSGLSRKKGKLNTEEYRKLKMLKFLEFLDNSYTRAYACKIIMHYVPTPEGTWV